MPEPPVIERETSALKSGWRSSEFWLTILAHVLSVLILAEVFPPDSKWDKLAAVGLSMLAQYGYTAGRSRIKTAAEMRRAQRRRRLGDGGRPRVN